MARMTAADIAKAIKGAPRYGASGGYTGKGPYQPIFLITCESTITRAQEEALRRSYSVTADGFARLDVDALKDAGLKGLTIHTALPSPRPTR